MKRRVISFCICLALCLSLCPTRALAANVTLSCDQSGSTYDITCSMLFNGGGHTYTVSDAAAMIVRSGGDLYLANGTVESEKGAGVEVKNGGVLTVEDARVTVIGTTYGLDIFSDAGKVQLSGGTYTGGTAAIRSKVDYASLLKTGYAFFDESGKPIPLTGVDKKTTVTVQKCTDHLYSYSADPKAPAHSWTCLACGAAGAASCTFNFDETGRAACVDCGHTIAITIDPDEVVYDGTFKPAGDPVQVMLSGKKLTKGTHYTVSYTTRIDVGKVTITVTVNGNTYNGTFRIVQAQPTIAWAEEAPVSVKYDGAPPVDDLPDVRITAETESDEAELERFLYYSYQKDGDSDFTEGLPTDAGTYKIKVNLPATTNYKAAESDLITLTIEKIKPITSAPKAIKPTYNGTAQELVTGGTARDGAVVLFATSANGPWSTDIPTGISAGDYAVYYRVDETKNYYAIGATEIDSVMIKRKPVTPVVDLSETSYVYDGGYKRPAVTVKDPDDGKVLLSTEYEVEYSNNRYVGTAAVTVTDADGGNYEITPEEGVVAEFKITAADQAALTITGQPDTVTYGDVFTLGTVGGSGSGAITWEITDGKDVVAAVDSASGQITVIGVGTAVVKATKSGADSSGGNREDATAAWTFTSAPKHVTAAVTAKDKPYDGTNTATVEAEVKEGVVSGDKIEITGLSGTFSGANAGTNKTVTLTVDERGAVSAQITIPADAQGNKKYIVMIPGTTTADITRAATEITSNPIPVAAPIYDGTRQALLTAEIVAAPTTGVDENGEKVQVEYALSKNGDYSTVIPTAANAGTYEVWYRVKESGNYFGTAAVKVDVTVSPKPVRPVVTLDPGSFEYDGIEKKPAVTVTYQETGEDGESDTITIPSSEYTVAYSNNVNAGTSATVTVTAKEGGNYTFDTVRMHFEITTGGKAILTSSPMARDLTYNGEEQELVTVGTATGGHMEYALEKTEDDLTEEAEGVLTEEAAAELDFKTEIPKGREAGLYKVYFKAAGDSNHEDSDISCVFVTIQPKTVVSPVIGLAEKTFTYDGSAKTFTFGETGKTDEITVKDGGDLIPNTEYTVTYSNNINAGTATVHIVNANGGNYIVNGSAAFEIGKARASFTAEPAAREDLTYNGKAHLLVTAGVAGGGTIVYSLEKEGPYDTAIPTGTDSGTYTVYAKVRGDANHVDSDHKDSAEDETSAESAGIVEITVTIAQITVTNPTIELSSATFRYNGSEQKPTVTVRDDGGNVIPENEYIVIYEEENASVGKHTIEIKSKGLNYLFKIPKSGTDPVTTTDTATAEFEILAADQASLTITGKPDIVHYGDTIQLGTTGGSGNGTVTWSIVVKGGDGAEDTETQTTDIAEIGKSTGQLKITGVGDVTIKAVRTPAGGSGYAPVEDTWTFHAYPKPVTAVVTAASKTYDGNTNAELTVTVPGADLTITSGVTGSFADANVGTGKTVDITVTDSVVSSSGNISNYDITWPDTATADITPKQIAAQVELTDLSAPIVYDGTEKKPDVTVSFAGETLIPRLNDDYTVTYSNNVNAGTATVTVKNVDGGNYTIYAAGNFEIEKANIKPEDVTVPEAKTGLAYTGSPQELITGGSSPDGKMVYSLEENGTYSEDIPTGIHAKEYTVYYKVLGDSNHNNYEVDMPITVTIAKADQAKLTITGIPGGTIYQGDQFTLSAEGGSGTGAVTWSSSNGDVATIDDNGFVTVHDAGSFTITATKAGGTNYNDAEATWAFTAYLESLPGGITVTAKTGLTYTGGAQELIAVDGTETWTGGTLLYSVNEGEYEPGIPTGKNAGTYTVWYKVEGDDNRVGSVTVTIAKAIPEIDAVPTASSITKGQPLSKSKITGGSVSYKTENENNNVPGTFSWKQGVTVPLVTARWSAIFTPDDQSNFEIVEGVSVRVEVEDNSSDSESASMQTTVKDGTASTVLNTAAGNKLVDEAVANGSENVVIKPEITGDVTRTEVSIPASTVGRIGSETDAALTISTPVADVTIPNGSLGTLSGAGGTVSVVTERVNEHTVVLTLTAGGRDVESVSGGLTLTAPVEEAGPGTVAVLVYEDGTRETIRWSVVEGDGIRIPLDGSATVEIVDNSKEFADVPANNWAAGAVAFASAHELFNGTGKATFSPEQSMSRAMLATVLYNLESNPDTAFNGAFADVESGVWYAESVSWAANCGIVTGYGNGSFGANDSITREQIAVMLWRYAGSPEVDGQSLNFVDADQVSGYAKEALYWATANGILNGYGSGRLDPGGLATRAQAAQMLKNFMENI